MNWRKKLFELAGPELEKLDVAHRVDHSLRVYKYCEKIARDYKNVNLDALYAASILHDIGYLVIKKNEHSQHSMTIAEKFLNKVGFPEKLVPLVEECIRKHDNYIWVKNHSNDKPKSLEARIFQDADRIENLGAIGIARNFSWAGRHDKVIWEDKAKWKDDVIFGGNISTLHTLRFELKNFENFNTKTAKKITKERYKFSKIFIKQLIKEWKN